MQKIIVEYKHKLASIVLRDFIFLLSLSIWEEVYFAHPILRDKILVANNINHLTDEKTII